VARSENKVRITAELFDARSDRSLWGETYDRDLRDVLALQGEVARSVADQIRVQLTPHENEQLASGHVVNPQAYEAYLKGLYYWNKRTELGFQQAVEYLKRSIELDPNYAPAYAGLSNSNMALSYYEFRPVKEMMVDALPAARKAIALDDSLAESHTSLAMLTYIGGWDWKTAENEYKRAIDLDPRYTVAHHFYSDFLSAMGRHDEALAQERQALQLEPQSPIINTWIAKRHYQARHYNEGIAAVQKALELEPNFTPALLQEGLLCVELKHYDEAIEALQKAVNISHGGLIYVATLGYAQAAAGKKAEARATLAQLQKLSKSAYVPSYYIATIYVALGENDNAFKWLDRAYDEHSAWIVNLNVDPALDPLRKDPQFASLVRRVGLPEASKQ
jgi:tetratricopeptide (TPR) repeat protein